MTKKKLWRWAVIITITVVDAIWCILDEYIAKLFVDSLANNTVYCLMQKTRKVLAEKIAQLNSAIDDVSSQLKSEDTPNGAALSTDEAEATVWNICLRNFISLMVTIIVCYFCVMLYNFSSILKWLPSSVRDEVFYHIIMVPKSFKGKYDTETTIKKCSRDLWWLMFNDYHHLIPFVSYLHNNHTFLCFALNHMFLWFEMKGVQECIYGRAQKLSGNPRFFILFH